MRVIKDANGNVLQNGDSVTVIKDLKVKGSSLVVKVGTKVKNIRLVDGDHDIDCKIDGIGAMKLTSDFERKARACGDCSTCERLPCGGLSLWFSVSLRRISTEKKEARWGLFSELPSGASTARHLIGLSRADLEVVSRTSVD